MPQFNPPAWGGEYTSKDYHFKMEGETPISPLVSLIGHALTSPNQELTDPVTQPVVRFIGGKIRTLIKTIRPAEVQGLTFTLLFGNALWTPALQRARKGGDCRTKFYAEVVCPSDADYRHAYIWPDVLLNPPVRVNDFITIEDTTRAEWQSELRAEQELILWQIGGFVVGDLTPPLYAIGFSYEDCVDCQEGEHTALYVTGGIGGEEDPLVIYKSDDRFSTSSSLANDAPDGSIGRALYVNGDIVLVGFADAGVAAGTIGGTLFSGDGESFTIDNSITEPIHGVGFYNGQYLAVGGTAAGAAKIYTSDDGVSWTAVVHANLPGSHALSAVAVDDEAGVFYVVGENGTCLKGSNNGGNIALAVLSPPSVGTTLLLSVHVFKKDHIAVGGASGYYAESFDGGATWTAPNMPGSGAVNGIAGNQERAMAGVTGTGFTMRDMFKNNQYKDVDLEDGASFTGDVMGVAGAKGEHNFFAGVTDDGEIIFWRPFYPNA